MSYKETDNKGTYGGGITRSEDRRQRRRNGDVCAYARDMTRLQIRPNQRNKRAWAWIYPPTLLRGHDLSSLSEWLLSHQQSEHSWPASTWNNGGAGTKVATHWGSRYTEMASPMTYQQHELLNQVFSFGCTERTFLNTNSALPALSSWYLQQEPSPSSESRACLILCVGAIIRLLGESIALSFSILEPELGDGGKGKHVL
ncbi:hypothetical protein BV22DRAFT_1052125 [Leucogyrophana mollusca]|uniref:Uncharacterized protein n=1 Tax=Leucogyrophana mollusca TaxID=85980 RepID=A0ACB8AXI4_9AGAM|nr:hypothetical protein BV22DRAFT_1052125 [Leucogyrophana mollusca]